MIQIADLFCGAGGTSTGALAACEELGLKARLTAINHWETAIATHTANHPDARHFCASIDTLNPRDLYGFGKLDVLWASPECMSHSRARGGKPINDQSRATAWCVTRWAEALQPGIILVENVEEFLDWGPMGSNGKTLKSRKGDTYRAWCGALRSLGYTVDHRILCAADYGDPTTRRRLFVQAVRGRRKIRWPDPTHFPAHDGHDSLFDHQPWVSAREIINWQHPTRSIFGRKRPLSPNTIRRIEIGLQKYGLRPFLVPQQQRMATRGLEKPLQTIVGSSRGEGLCQPFLVQTNHGKNAPHHKENHRVATINLPLGTVTGKNSVALCEPWIQRVGHYGKDGGNAAATHRTIGEPISTITTKQEHALAQPYLIHLRGTAPDQVAGSPRSLDQPLPTITSGGRHIALCEPFLTKFYGTATTADLREPLDTVTTKERFGLALPRLLIDGDEYLLDIHFRMLQPDELAAAQGFPSDYRFTGTKTAVTKQIGNAVPVNLSKALVEAVLAHHRS